MDARDQPKRIDARVACALVLHLGDVDALGKVRDAADGKQGLNCSAWLATDAPKMGDCSHRFRIDNDANAS